MDNKEKVNKRLQENPFIASGEVVKGFGRGSKDLGIPTANFPESVVESLPADINTGIYFGWARVEDGPIYKMVVSIGWNPFYNNEKKSVETHILNKFETDFYGCNLNIIMTGYIRPEMNFDSLDSLVAAINNDIDQANQQLDLEVMQKYKEQL